ncbi:hypothetical protein PDJAM_G00169470, partial [Pangasius djambal]|nr:hypothetical protein [Pangasius djambal]
MLRKCPAPPLLLSITLLISSMLASSSSSPPHNATHQPGVPNPRFFSPGEDYSDYNEET